jgi:hypothetical protein
MAVPKWPRGVALRARPFGVPTLLNPGGPCVTVDAGPRFQFLRRERSMQPLGSLPQGALRLRSQTGLRSDSFRRRSSWGAPEPMGGGETATHGNRARLGGLSTRAGASLPGERQTRRPPPADPPLGLRAAARRDLAHLHLSPLSRDVKSAGRGSVKAALAQLRPRTRR